MQVNSERWGTPDTWVEYIQSAGICRPSNAKNSYAMAYNLGSTPDESMHTDIDLSVAPWGLNKNSLLNKRYYIAPYGTPDDVNPVDLIPINEEELTKDKPLILNGIKRIVTAGGSSFSNDAIFDGNVRLLNNYNPNYPQFSSVTTYTNWAINNVICNFNYHNIMMLPLIVTSPGSAVNDSNIFNINTYTSGMFYTFDEFIANYDSQIKGKKVVKGFMVVEYLGNNGNRSKNSTNDIQYTIPYKVPARPSFPDMADNNKRFPTVNIDTMVSSSAWSDGSYAGTRTGFPNVRHADWLRWYNTYTNSPEKSINYWSGANYGGTNTDWRTTCFDDEIFEYYYQPYVSGQNRQGIALIRTEDKTATEIVNYFAKQAAYLGFMFAWNETDALTGIIGENNSICIPTFDSGITTGNYTRGTANINNPAFLWRDDVYEKNNYDPSGSSGGSTPWDDNPITRIQEGYWTGFGGNTYVSSVSDFQDTFDLVQAVVSNHLSDISGTASLALNDYLNASTAEDQEEKWGIYYRITQCLEFAAKTNSEIYTSAPNTNYTDCVLSILRYPFDISGYFSREGSSSSIKWGHINVLPENVDIWKVNGYNTGQIVQGGSLYVEKKYDNFLNYAPYTTAELYIPYCGSVPIDLEVFAGHTIDVKYLVDWFSGSCLALIYRDSVVVDQIAGQMGTSVGIVAEDIQSYQNAMFNGSQTLKAQKNAFKNSFVNGMGQSMDQLSGAIGNVATAVLGGEPSSSNAQSGGGSFAKGFNVGTGVAQNYQNVKTAKYNLDHTYIDFKQLGSNGPSVGSWNEQVCRLVLYYPTFLPGYNPAEYGHTVGFACLFNKTLDEFSGLTVCSSVDTSGLTNATESEKTLIEDALKSGVYL